MTHSMTRAKTIQVWFLAVALVVAAAVTFGMSVTTSTAVTLFALSLVPPTIVLILWPGVQPPTVGDVLRDVDRRS